MPQPSKSALTRFFSQVEFTDGEKEYKAHKRLAFEEVTPMTIKFDRYGKTQAFQNAENVFYVEDIKRARERPKKENPV